ncbi:MAG: prepilin peptidase [Akkermansiaceae bacterium]|nr:prepilin peptidase [Akkermansiaceae bacterium]MCP5551566.1 prepilin peptidase [Akkermansiaceae bacterium]
MDPIVLRQTIELVFAFIFGSVVGSFLNVVIYRVPLGMSVNEPKRSFCPNCRTRIPVWLNIPLVTWLMLGGKCKWCKTRISVRYFIVELLTAVLFLAVWHTFVGKIGYGGAFFYCVFMALLVAATFIDFDHFIIPDSITLGGLVAGLIASVAFPALHGEVSHWRGLWMAVVGAAAGYGLLWSVVNLGKLAFGKLNYEFDEPAEWTVTQPDPEENPVIAIGEHTKSWDDVFFRDSDRLVLTVSEFELNGERHEVAEVVLRGDKVEFGGETVALEAVKSIRGRCTKAVVPREAMGFGDVKFIAMIGAFLGWQAVLFTVFAAAIAGSVIGLLQKAFAREEWSRPLPFGPYLTLGAVLWVFAGEAFLGWYLGLMGLATPRG